MTDMEGVAGVANSQDWALRDGRYYERGRRLLTEEVNAAVSGFAVGGFGELVVCDAHGPGGIDIETLDPRVRLSRGWPREEGGNWPFGIDETYDALAFVGQHAKAGTPFSHLTHTGSMEVVDVSINGLSVGEYGMVVLVAGERGVPVIFASGEKALCEEATALTPGVVTAAVLEGTIGGTGDTLTPEEYRRFHAGAIHLHPAAACELITQRAEYAARTFCSDRDHFRPLEMSPPYHVVCRLRHSGDRRAQALEFHDERRISSAFNSMSKGVEKALA